MSDYSPDLCVMCQMDQDHNCRGGYTCRDARKLQAKLKIAVDALQFLYDETADYIKINNLSAMNNQSMRMAREALKAIKDLTP